MFKIDEKIKTALTLVMGRDSKNRTPTIDIEPFLLLVFLTEKEGFEPSRRY